MKTYYVFLTLAVSFSPSWLYAQAVTDGTMGPIQTLSGQFTVPASLGTTNGINLFHSFKAFNVNSGESATFTGPNSISNVITRVTGGEMSSINGLLRSQVGNANFYFINPSGIVFGYQSKIDVPAAFHAGAVDTLHFLDGTPYGMATPTNSLSISAPENFGLTAASLNNNGFLHVDSTDLTVNNNQTLELAAKTVEIHDSHLTANEGNIKLLGGDVGMVASSISSDTYSASNAGNIDISATKVAISDTAKITASSNEAGRGGVVSIKADNIVLDGNNKDAFTGIAANATSTGQAGKVNVQATSLTIQGGAEMNSSTFGTGDANSVTVVTRDLTIDGKSNTFGSTGIGSRANADSRGQAGNISVTANSIALINGGVISSATSSTGNAGIVDINTQALHIDGQKTGIDSSSNSTATGNAGLVTVKADELTITHAGTIDSSSFGKGKGGAVQVQSDVININGKESAQSAFTGISSNAFGNGDAGNVTVMANTLTLTESGRIASNTTGDANAGDVSVVANKININGNNSAIYTGIASNTYNGKGNAGTVDVKASQLIIDNAGRITSNTRGKGRAGNVIINAENIDIDAKNSDYLAGIASAASPDSTGQVGNIYINASNHISLNNEAQISIQNRGAVLDGEPIAFGKIDIITPYLSLSDHSVINAQSTQNADASNITLQIANSLQMNLSSISTQANSGNGGAINLNTGDYIDLQQSSITTSVTSSIGNGGNITVSSPALVIDNGMVQANAYSGHGGDVFIHVNSLIGSQNQLIQGGDKPLTWKDSVPGFNIIQAASKFGLSGTVKVTSPQLDLSGVLIGLNTSSFGRDLLSHDYCAIGMGSSLTIRGFGVLPLKASDLLY